tara:strand:- start:2085 stop:3323 length:1239 start_codon:yes stop_codon:yes gene_type:complete
MVTPIDQLNAGLLGRRPRGLDSMGSGLLSPIPRVNIGSQLMSAAQPTALGKVRGALGQSLSNPNILRGIAAGLLSGPSRTPVSFGQSLLGGLQAGQQLQEAEEDRKLKRMLAEAELSKLQRGTMPKLGASKTYYDQQGNPINVYTRQTLMGGLEALEVGTNQPVDLTGLTTDKPETITSKISAEKASQYTVLNPETGQREVKTLQYMTINGVEDLYESVPPTPENPRGIKKVPFGNVIPFEPEPIREGMDAQAVKAYNEANELRQTIVSLDEFEGLINEGFAGGIESKVKGLTGDLKSAFGNTDLTRPEELIKLLKAKQNTLLGKLRVAIVGPGVMTEQDAQRVIEALGGDISNWTANPQILVQAIRDARATAARDFASKQALYGGLKEGKFPELLGLPEGVQDVTSAVGDF